MWISLSSAGSSTAYNPVRAEKEEGVKVWKEMRGGIEKILKRERGRKERETSDTAEEAQSEARAGTARVGITVHCK